MSILLIGASSAIANSVMHYHSQRGHPANDIIAISSQTLHELPEGVQSIHCDYSETSIANVVKVLQDQAVAAKRIYIFNGVLHGQNVKPEKRLQDIQLDVLQQQFFTNSIVPLLWIKHLLPIFKRSASCVLTVFSARVGSISDNRLGGWYSYRASKSALNMLLKCTAIELQRIAPQVKILAYHPGTIATPLSAPFTKTMDKKKLFSPEQGVLYLEQVINALPEEGNFFYRDWNNTAITF